MAKALAKVRPVTVKLKLTGGQKTALAQALDRVEEHVAKVAEVWPRLNLEQRQQVLDAAPLFARIAQLAERLR